jgi:hypothetical protein
MMDSRVCVAFARAPELTGTEFPVADPILITAAGLAASPTALALAQRGNASRVLEGAPEFGAIGYRHPVRPQHLSCASTVSVSPMP